MRLTEDGAGVGAPLMVLHSAESLVCEPAQPCQVPDSLLIRPGATPRCIFSLLNVKDRDNQDLLSGVEDCSGAMAGTLSFSPTL